MDQNVRVHSAHKLPKDLKKWQIRHAAEKESQQVRSMDVKRNFWERMHLHVDQPRSGGKGSSNDGNTARRAFRDEEMFAAVTGVDRQLIHQMHIILQTMSSGYVIDIQAFHAYCTATADRYVEMYPWYPMPAAVHKILLHGAAVVESLVLPIGMLSEEAQESRNKDVRAYRLDHARKDSRLHTMADQFGYLMVTSDPLISSSTISDRCRRAQGRTLLAAEALALLRGDIDALKPAPSEDSDTSDDD